MGQPDSETQFAKTLKETLERARFVARATATRLLRDVEIHGGALEVARRELAPMPESKGASRGGDYFLALARRQRLDLSIEALVLTKPWSELFTREESERARERLAQESYAPPLMMPMAGPVLPEEPLLMRLPFDLTGFFGKAGERMGESRGSTITLCLRCIEQGAEILCARVAEMDGSLQKGMPLQPCAVERKHLDECQRCRNGCPRVLQAYDSFDRESIDLLSSLIAALKRALGINEQRIQNLAEEDFQLSLAESPEPSSEERDGERAMDMHVKRAILLGVFTGRLMRFYTLTRDVRGHLRIGPPSSDPQLEELLSRMGPDEYLAALVARNLDLVFDLPLERNTEPLGLTRQPEGNTEPLSLPSHDGDLETLPGVMYIEGTADLNEWEQLVGEWDFLMYVRPLPLLYLVCLRAKEEAGIRGSGLEETGSLSALLQQLVEIRDRIESNSALQMPIIELLGNVLRHLNRTDRQQVEASLLQHMGDVFQRLCPAARLCLVGAEQIYQHPNFARRASIVAGLAQGFEIQAKRTVFQPFCRHLDGKGIRTFPPLANPARTRPICQNGRYNERATLGDLLAALELGSEELNQFCRDHGIDREALAKALRDVKTPRNSVSHGEDLPESDIVQLREEWLGINNGDGGIFRLVV